MSPVSSLSATSLIMTTSTLPYSISTSSAFNAFKKLQGVKNYADWKDNMHIMLLSLWQWGIVDGSIARPVPINDQAITNNKTAMMEAWDLRAVSAYMEIKYHLAITAKAVLMKSQDLKVVWDMLEKQFGSCQEGLQSSLTNKLQCAMWDGQGLILTHQDYMYDLCAQLTEMGLVLSDQSFHCYFVDLLPPSHDIYITFHDDKTYNVDNLCKRITRHEARQKLQAAKLGLANALSLSDSNVALYGQQSEKKKGKARDLKDVTCYGCGEKGHLCHHCLNLKTNDKSKEAKDNKPKPEASSSKAESSGAKKPSSGALYMAVVNSSVVVTEASSKFFYIDSRVSAHLILSKGDLCGYQKFEHPLEIAAANNGTIYAYGSSTAWVTTSADGVE